MRRRRRTSEGNGISERYERASGFSHKSLNDSLRICCLNFKVAIAQGCRQDIKKSQKENPALSVRKFPPPDQAACIRINLAKTAVALDDVNDDGGGGGGRGRGYDQIWEGERTERSSSLVRRSSRFVQLWTFWQLDHCSLPPSLSCKISAP